jgi:hypothetical protein
MKKKIAFILLALILSFTAGAAGNPTINIVPKPAKIKVLQGSYRRSLVFSPTAFT